MNHDALNTSLLAPPRPSITLHAHPKSNLDAWQIDRGDIARTAVLATLLMLLLLLLRWVCGKTVPVDNCCGAGVERAGKGDRGNYLFSVFGHTKWMHFLSKGRWGTLVKKEDPVFCYEP